MTDEKLISAAREAMTHSYAPYSRFNVGAALLTKSGRVFTGCNIENASYGATVCAERTAAFKAVSEDEREFTAIAVVGGKDGVIKDFTPPCGICRQVLSEFAADGFAVLMCDADGTVKKMTLTELLPLSFCEPTGGLL